MITTGTPSAARRAERGVEQLDRLDRRDRPVVDVAGNEHGVDVLVTHHVDEEVDEPGLRLEQGLTVQRTAQVPVGGVEQPHAVEGTQRVGQLSADARPEPGQGQRRAWRPEARATVRSTAARMRGLVGDDRQPLPGPGDPGVQQLPGEDRRTRLRERHDHVAELRPLALVDGHRPPRLDLRPAATAAGRGSSPSLAKATAEPVVGRDDEPGVAVEQRVERSRSRSRSRGVRRTTGARRSRARHARATESPRCGRATRRSRADLDASRRAPSERRPRREPADPIAFARGSRRPRVRSRRRHASTAAASGAVVGPHPRDVAGTGRGGCRPHRRRRHCAPRRPARRSPSPRRSGAPVRARPRRPTTDRAAADPPHPATAAGPTTSPSTAPASMLASWYGSPTSTSRASGRTASSSRAISGQRDHRRLVDHDDVGRERVVAVVAELEASGRAEEPVDRRCLGREQGLARASPAARRR